MLSQKECEKKLKNLEKKVLEVADMQGRIFEVNRLLERHNNLFSKIGYLENGLSEKVKYKEAIRKLEVDIKNYINILDFGGFVEG